MPVACCPGEFGNLIIDFDVEKVYSSWLRDPQIRKRIREALPRIEDQGKKFVHILYIQALLYKEIIRIKRAQALILRKNVPFLIFVSAGPEITDEMMLEDYCEDRHTSRKRRRDDSPDQHHGLSNEQCRTQ